MNINDFLSPHIIFWFEIALCISLGVALLIYVFLAYRRLEYMERLPNKCSRYLPLSVLGQLAARKNDAVICGCSSRITANMESETRCH